MHHPSIQYRPIPHDSADYLQTLRLRDQVLRRPWGHSIEEDDLSMEYQDLIFGAFDGEKLVGMATLQDDGTGYNRLRYMAVDPAYRRLGIGAVIAREFESRSRQAGKAGIRLMARTRVVDFYGKLGYRLDGQPFTPGHIPVEHVMMVLVFS